MTDLGWNRADMAHMEEYPFIGRFYVTRLADEDAPLLEQEAVTELAYETKCDVQQASILGNAGFKTTSYNVYFPLVAREQAAASGAGGWAERYEDIPVARGMRFVADVWGYQVDGVVEGVGFSMLGGCVAQIKDSTEE